MGKNIGKIVSQKNLKGVKVVTSFPPSSHQKIIDYTIIFGYSLIQEAQNNGK